MTSPNMGLVYPTLHGSSDVWGDILDTIFDTIDVHDHTTGKGVPVPSAGLRINADVAWAYSGTAYAITGAKGFATTPTAASSVTSYTNMLFANSSDSNNLYFRNSSGTNVQITSGSTINVSVVGGIGGDYASVGALLSFDDATDSYWLQQQGSPRPWARIRVGDVDIYETAASVTQRIRLQSPAALAASYALTFPGALPGSTLAIQSSSAGVLTFSNAFTGPVTSTTDITANVSTGIIKGAMFIETGPKTLFVSASSATGQTGGGTGPSSWDGQKWSVLTTTGNLSYPVNLTAHAGVTTKITGWTFYYRKTSATGTITATLSYYDESSGGLATIGSAQTDSRNNPGFVSFTVTGLTHTITNGRAYVLNVTGGGTTGDEFNGLEVTYTES